MRCALVAVRQVRDDGDRRRVDEEYAERFPSINFVAGLDDELTSMRTQLGVDADWKEAVRKLYYEPFVVLVRPRRRHARPAVAPRAARARHCGQRDARAPHRGAAPRRQHLFR